MRSYGRTLRWLLSVLLIFSTAAQVVAQNTKQTPTGYTDTLVKQAESGDAKAQFDLAGAYFKGEGIPKDDVEAVRWLRKSAEQGYAKAESNLGVMYVTGQGVAKDEAEAVRWLRKAAEQGDAKAQHRLGLMYAYGKGIPKDDVEAVRWYRKAAEQGDAGAQFSLAGAYFKGEGVPKDDVEAVRWCRKAAEQGFANAQYSLGSMYANGQGVAKDEAEAVLWYRKAAEQGNVEAKNALGHQAAEQGDAKKPAWEVPMGSPQNNLRDQAGTSDRKLTVVAASHQTNEFDYTTSTPQTSNTNCNVFNTSIQCNTTSRGGVTQTHAVYRLQQVVTSNEGGRKIRYVLTRTARWRWSSTDWLSEGESFPAEIKGKHMYIKCRKGGNQGKEETLKYDILDIRPVQ